MKRLLAVVFAALYVMCGGVSVAAGTDSSADAGGYVTTLLNAPGIMIKVPIDEQQRENGAAAELKIASSGAVVSAEDLPAAWDKGTSTEWMKVVTKDDIAKDSSTWGWFGYWSSPAWYPSYYYASYTPSFYYSGNYYNWSAPNYYTYYPYRYYYYPSYW